MVQPIEPRSHTEPPNLLRLPVALVVSADPQLDAKVRLVAQRCRVLVRACLMASARAQALALRPHAILVPSAIYALAPAGFDLLADDVGAMLVRLDEATMPALLVEHLLRGAVLASVRLRSLSR